MQTIFNQITAERSRQDTKHGGPSHDDTHQPIEWVQFIRDRAVVHPTDTWRHRLVEIAALAVAAIESHDRKNPAPIKNGDFWCPMCDGLHPLPGQGPTPHVWEPLAGWPSSQGETPRTCSGCGSLHPDDVIRLIKSGYCDEPSTKGYKAYLHAAPGQALPGPGKFYIPHFTREQIDELNRVTNRTKPADKPAI